MSYRGEGEIQLKTYLFIRLTLLPLIDIQRGTSMCVKSIHNAELTEVYRTSWNVRSRGLPLSLRKAVDHPNPASTSVYPNRVRANPLQTVRTAFILAKIVFTGPRRLYPRTTQSPLMKYVRYVSTQDMTFSHARCSRTLRQRPLLRLRMLQWRVLRRRHAILRRSNYFASTARAAGM